jgi:hypothetical protein
MTGGGTHCSDAGAVCWGSLAAAASAAAACESARGGAHSRVVSSGADGDVDVASCTCLPHPRPHISTAPCLQPPCRFPSPYGLHRKPPPAYVRIPRARARPRGTHLCLASERN